MSNPFGKNAQEIKNNVMNKNSNSQSIVPKKKNEKKRYTFYLEESSRQQLKELAAKNGYHSDSAFLVDLINTIYINN